VGIQPRILAAVMNAANPPPSGPPAWVANGTVQGVAGGNFSLAWPVGYQDGDLAIILIDSDTHIGFDTPAGWSVTPNSNVDSGPFTLQSFYKIVNGAQANVAITNAQGGDARGIILLFRGVDTSAPIAVSAYASSLVLGTGKTFPAVNTSTGNNLIVNLMVFSSAVSMSGWTNASLENITERLDGQAGGFGLAMAEGVKTDAGEVAQTTVTASNNTFAGMLALALKP
jgi:hypothetical protein